MTAIKDVNCDVVAMILAVFVVFFITIFQFHQISSLLEDIGILSRSYLCL